MLSTRRLIILSVIIGLAVLVTIARAAQVQLVEGLDYSAEAASQQTSKQDVQAPRGAIFDRNGNVLAVSNRAYSVRVDASTLTDTMAVATALAPVVLRPTDEVRRELESIVNPNPTLTTTRSTLVAYHLTLEQTNQLTTTLKQLNRGGLLLERGWRRDYPFGPIAGPTLGFVSLQPIGYSGVEGYYNARLNSEVGTRTERGPMELLVITPTHEGADVVLTLDLNLQNYAEGRLAQAIQDTGANGGTVIVMDTATGAILASASTPGYDPNRAVEIANGEFANTLRDPAVSDPYEPGSVLKLATFAAALESGQVTTSTIMTDTGRLTINGKRIYNSDRSRHGRVDVEDILAKSLNVPTAEIALAMGETDFYRAFKLFGFGSRTGIDLGNESSGTLRTPADIEWSRTDLATNSYGQGMSATPYQVINAVNAIANDGVLMQPYIVREWREADGGIVKKQPVPIQRVISAETARVLRDVMTIATRRGTPDVKIKGYTIAGKTGTADWYLRGVLQDTTIVTYVGFVPASAPKLTILVKLDQPRSSRWAAATTTPVFRDLAERAVQIIGVAPDVTEK